MYYNFVECDGREYRCDTIHEAYRVFNYLKNGEYSTIRLYIDGFKVEEYIRGEY